MKLVYCEICGTLIHERPPKRDQASHKVLCSNCLNTPKDKRSKRRRKIRDSGQIPKAKLEQAQKMGKKKIL